MSTLQEMLAAQQAADPTTVDPTLPPSDPIDPPPEDPPLNSPTEELQPLPETIYQIGDTYVPPPGSYKRGRQHMVIRADGKKLLANLQGYFIPETDEDRELLAYYAGLNAGLVEAV